MASASRTDTMVSSHLDSNRTTAARSVSIFSRSGRSPLSTSRTVERSSLRGNGRVATPSRRRSRDHDEGVPSPTTNIMMMKGVPRPRPTIIRHECSKFRREPRGRARKRLETKKKTTHLHHS